MLSHRVEALFCLVWESVWATESLSVNNASLTSFPIGIPGLDSGGIFDTQHFLGLGSNSTFLSTLQNAGLIASKTWGTVLGPRRFSKPDGRLSSLWRL
jgi:hypothetical protein